jgi:hypothetical protein
MLRKISQGYWPKHPKQMNDAMAQYIHDCAHNPQTPPPPEASLTGINWNEVGGIAVEGWTSISSVIMRYLPDKGINVGGENRLSVNKDGTSMSFMQAIIVEDQLVQEVFGSNTRGDYNFVKNTLSGLVANMNSLPCHSILYTALEAKTTEDGEKTGKPIYGPDIAGKKASTECGAWVGDLLHAQDYPVPEKTTVKDPADPAKEIEQVKIKTAVRFFFHKHPDPDTGILFPAKPRCAPERIKELDSQFPGGFFEPEWGAEWGVDKYLKFMDYLAQDAAQQESLKGWREKMDQKLGKRNEAIDVRPRT